MKTKTINLITSLLLVLLVIPTEANEVVIPHLNEGALLQTKQNCKKDKNNIISDSLTGFAGTALMGLGVYIISKTGFKEEMDGIPVYTGTTLAIAGGVALYYVAPKLWKALQPQNLLDLLIEVNSGLTNGPMLRQLTTLCSENGINAQNLLNDIVRAANDGYLCLDAKTIEQVMNKKFIH